MPRHAAGRCSLHYESTGAGAHVLLVMGLGMNATGWRRTVPCSPPRLSGADHLYPTADRDIAAFLTASGD